MRDLALALAADTIPGESAIGRALRDSEVWPALTNILMEVAGTDQGNGYQVFQLQIWAEEAAQRERARQVAERHLVVALPRPSWEGIQVRFDRLLASVRRAELGPELGDNTGSGGWHGLVDANILIQYKPLEDINWRDETGSADVTLWIPGSLLNELDFLKFLGGSRRVRERAMRFTAWLDERMDDCLAAGGLRLRDGVRLRVWSGSPSTGARDTDHLEAASTLRALGIDAWIVTADTGFRSRARLNGFHVLKPNPDKWQLVPELTPRERETAERLRQAGLDFPPELALTAELEINRWLLKLVADSNGGEGRDIHVVWHCHGGVDITARGVSENRALERDAAGSFRQGISVQIPPGETSTLAYLGFSKPPFAITYAIRAAKGYVARGQLKFTAHGFEPAAEGDAFPAEPRAEF